LLAAVQEARRQAQADPQKTMFLHQDEFTYYRRPSVAQTWHEQGGPGAKARQGCRTNSKRRVIGALNALPGQLPPGPIASRANCLPGQLPHGPIASRANCLTGQLTVWQRSRADAKTMARYLRALEEEYPQAEVIYVALDNWPVHFHEHVLKALKARRCGCCACRPTLLGPTQSRKSGDG
jgi:hypothetical protein